MWNRVSVRAVLAVAVVVFLCVVAIVFLDSGRRKEAAQAVQNVKSYVAGQSAGQNAVETVGERATDDAAIDKGVTDAQREIDNAETVDDARAAVVRARCLQRNSGQDPACRV